jgi:hypothetical protein
MGTNSAPELANLTLYHDESQFIDNFIKQKQIEKAKEHCFNFRLIDDILKHGMGNRHPVRHMASSG